MRELLAFALILLVAANTVNSGAIYRRYRELEFPAEAAASADAPPAEGYVAELRKDQIPVQVVEVIEPVLVVKPLENLRSIAPVITVAEAEQAPLITNEIIPEKIENLQAEADSENVRAIEQAIAKEAELPQPVAEVIAEAIAKQEGQQLRNIESEIPAIAPAIVLLEELPSPKEQEKIPLAKEAEKKLLLEAIPEPLPEILPKKPLPETILEEKKAEQAEPLKAGLPELKAIKEEEKPLKDALSEEMKVAKEELPSIPLDKKSELKSLEENVAPVGKSQLKSLGDFIPAVKSLREDEPLMEAPKEEAKIEEPKEQLLEQKKEERREEKKDDIQEEVQGQLKQELKELKTEAKEDIKETLPQKATEMIKDAETQGKIDPKPLEGAEIAPQGKQADNAAPAPTTARPPQPGFIQQLVQNSPLGQLFNSLNPNNQAAPEENSPAATAATFIQALQNTTTQITNSIQQGFQQQLASLQTTLSGQPPQQQQAAAAAAGDGTAATTARPQGPLQSIVTSFLGNGQQQSAAPAQPQPAGPLQGILNLFGGNRNPAAAPAPAAAASIAAAPAAAAASAAVDPAPAAAAAQEAQPANEENESSPSESVAADDSSPEAARDSIETAEDSQEEVKPDEIVVSDDDSHE